MFCFYGEKQGTCLPHARSSTQLTHMTGATSTVKVKLFIGKMCNPNESVTPRPLRELAANITNAAAWVHGWAPCVAPICNAHLTYSHAPNMFMYKSHCSSLHGWTRHEAITSVWQWSNQMRSASQTPNITRETEPNWWKKSCSRIRADQCYILYLNIFV